MHKAIDIPNEFSPFAAHNNGALNLDELCSGTAWNANTCAIFVLEKFDLLVPLVDTSISLEAVGGDVVSLVNIGLLVSMTRNL